MFQTLSTSHTSSIGMRTHMRPPILAALFSLALGSTAGAQESMRAAAIHAFGGPEVLRIEQTPRPAAGPGELLVRVHAAGVNPVDTQTRRGVARGLSGERFPYITGFDVAGEVVQVGPEVTRFRAGDRIFAHLDLRRGGGYAEYAIVKEEEAAPLPQRTTYVEAASVPLVALTAWQAFFDTAELQPGETVLIHAGAGGVGSIAIQIAKWHGARVIATASAENHPFLRELGADVVVDYRSQRFEDFARGVDVVLDPIGGETQSRSLAILRDGGRLVSIVGLIPEARSPAREVVARSILVRPDAAQLARIGQLIDEGILMPIVSHVFPLESVAEAHEQSETGRTRGKIVLQL
jgi:NADPH:quinone reductase-like Zn-dependent oxidoreductase